jgi:hypothetical protein
MASFQDRHGKTWPIEITLGVLTRVRSETGIDLLTLHEPESPALQALRDDPVALLAVLLVVLRPRLREAGVSDDQFADSLQEEHVWGAVEALLTGMIDYYPPAKRAPLQTLLATLLSAARKVRDKATRTLQQTVGTTDLETLETQIVQHIDRSMSGGSTSSSPASPAGSTPSG